MSTPTTACGLHWTTGEDQLGPDVVSGVSWAPGEWVLIQENTPAGYRLVCAMSPNMVVITAINTVESLLEVGWGTTVENICLVAGFPYTIGHSNPGAWDLMLPVPQKVPTGVNLYIRYRTSDIGTKTLTNVALGYYQSYDNLHETDLALYREPDAANGTTINFTGVNWDWSAWGTVSAGPPSAAYLAGLSIFPTNTAFVYTNTEFEIGLGAGPTSIGTLPVTAANEGALEVAWLPRVVPVAAGVPIKVRMRSVYTHTDGVRVAPVYYADPAEGCSQAEVPPPTPATRLYADRRVRQFSIPTDENQWIFIHEIELELQRGQGLAEGQGQVPQVMFSLSRDGGQTWGPERWVDAGRLGEYLRRVRWLQCGRARNPVGRIVVSDPIFWAFQACYLKSTTSGSR